MNDDNTLDPLEPEVAEVDTDADLAEEEVGVEDEDAADENVFTMTDDGEIEEAL